MAIGVKTLTREWVIERMEEEHKKKKWSGNKLFAPFWSVLCSFGAGVQFLFTKSVTS